MFCSSCGKEIENSKFCPFCGSPVDSAEAPAAEAEAPAEAAEEPKAETPAEEPAAEAPAEAVEEPKAEETAEAAPEAEAPAEAVEESKAEETAEAAPEAETVIADAVIDAADAAKLKTSAEETPVEPAPAAPANAFAAAPTATEPVTDAFAAPGTVDANKPVEAPVVAEPEAEAEKEEKPKKKGKKIAIIIIRIAAALILLAGAGVGVFFYLLNSKYTQATEAFENEDYEKSLQLFTELNTYKDSAYWAEASQVELDYQKVDALVEAEDWDGAVKILKEVSDFYDTDTKGVEASALMTDCNIIKDAFNDKNAGNYSSAKGKFRQLTKLKDKYAKEPALCEAHEAEKSKQWMTVITTCYGIQIKDYELNYLKNPTGDNDKIISDAFTKDSDDYKAIEAIMKPEGDEEKALVETALKGLKLKQALRLADEMKYDEALALLEELGDFDEAKAKYTSVKEEYQKYKDSYAAAEAYYNNGEYYKAMMAWMKIEKYLDSNERAKSCEQKMPSNGSMKKGSGAISLKIKAPATMNTLIRVYNSKGEVAAQVFVEAGKNATVKLGAGTYTMKVAYGNKWYGEKDLFGGTGIYLQLKNGTSNNFTLKKNHSYTLTLQSGTSGNVGADTVSGGASGM